MLHLLRTSGNPAGFSACVFQACLTSCVHLLKRGQVLRLPTKLLFAQEMPKCSLSQLAKCRPVHFYHAQLLRDRCLEKHIRGGSQGYCQPWCVLQVLGTVHLMAERVHPPKATLKLAQEAYKVHNYDKDLDLSDVVTQRELSLTATWDRLIAHIARHTDMEDDDFACVFEDDIALHDDVTHAVARRAILHGMELGRADGLLSLGMCAPDCQNSTQQWVENVKFEKCASLCTHAVAVTKRKAGTLMADLHAAVHEDFEKWGYDSYYHGHAIDQQLRLHAWHNNGTWTAGTNLYSMETPWWDTHLGLFYQDRWRARPSINPDGD